ncbi:MAG: hypothetical protein WBM61_14180 [Woeseiaceae bacterium]
MSHIVRKARTSARSWMFIYLSLIASIVFADQADFHDVREPASIAPVVTSGAAPILSIDTFVRRSDI